MKTIIVLLIALTLNSLTAQIQYGTPINDQLPEKLKSLPRAIEVNNFPKTIDPIKIDDRYYWKHNTAILCRESEIKIIEYGAYLFYNDTWNLRKSYSLKDLNKNFGTKKQIMKQSQPYTWANNWRTDSSIFRGWAMWYFIGTTKDGETVCGYEKIETTDTLLN
ncbi:hypothetical protein [uncultured Aquimarina sp.]|uniref:hypothetical protein n=1 Tax=uncultured Aquimarina sp. TaxID=575652 RepID=UPI0026272EFF|nr:hypothetical protein [uncultured Aquimarina sp.]